VRIAAASINPFDIMRRSGAAKDAAPIKFPGVVGVDLSGTILKVAPGVSGFSVGDQVFGRPNICRTLRHQGIESRMLNRDTQR
jgi:NADPH:quinone reductase-like Zn-dependent oxidoreductase